MCNNCMSFISSPTKITLIGAVLFALQQTNYLPLQKRHLMLIYTIFTVVNKVSLPASVTPTCLKGLETSTVNEGEDKDSEDWEKQIFWLQLCFVSALSRLPHDLSPFPVLKF